jgi:cation:H+ antiporter
LDILASLPAVIALILGLALLVGGGELLVRGAAALTLKADIPPLIIGLTVVSMGTSAPELFASVEAALAGTPGLAVGNVLGSNVANLALILGLTALVCPLKVDRMALRLDIPLMLGISVLFLFAASDLAISRTEGMVGLALMAAFLANLYWRSQRQGAQDAQDGEDVQDGEEVESLKEAGEWAGRSAPFLLGALALGIGGLYLGAECFVDGARRVALQAGVSNRVVGLTIVAFGTSVPELVASGIAALRGQADMAIGNVVGSNLFNLLLVLGTTATITPLPMGPEVLTWDVWWVLGTAAALIPLALLGGMKMPKLGRWQGALFLLAYLTYTALTWMA